MNEIEERFVNAFIVRDKRERWLSLLPSEKGRAKVTNRLAHIFVEDLDPRFVFDKDAPPPDVAAKAEAALTAWEMRNPQKLCYVIANNSGVDGQTIPLNEAERDYRLTFGAILILVPDRLAYYHTERSNLNQQPYYLLLRPQP